MSLLSLPGQPHKLAGRSGGGVPAGGWEPWRRAAWFQRGALEFPPGSWLRPHLENCRASSQQAGRARPTGRHEL